MRARLSLLLLLGACASPPSPATTAAPAGTAGTLRQTPPPELQAKAAAVGAPAPPLSLLTQTGETWSLADPRHRPAVLAFYRGHW